MNNNSGASSNRIDSAPSKKANCASSYVTGNAPSYVTGSAPSYITDRATPQKINCASSNRIGVAFSHGKAFIPFITGGDPDITTTGELIYALCGSGADMIEIGVPFSDPIAEGPVIEAADARALGAGCTADGLFRLVEQVRARVGVPILFMTYYNPVFVYGNDAFAKRCAECGIDGLIVPDLPFEERSELLAPCRANGLELISLVAPTSDERTDMIAQGSTGFLYCVSSLGVTGERKALDDGARSIIARAKLAAPGLPCAVGFGVSTPEQARAVAIYADGVIVGSAFVRLVAEHGRAAAVPVARFADNLRRSI